ncbi:RNA polymerase sigma factor [Brevibacillus ruminantium]|uniref:RNA polymerase sigma factor n=1 Tax=Brevibacillus ruminantium TaxID=2950604 RepID=A0ABY4WMX7_9BACL|nr:RNA polymerase sigma factor [Brevibacillus ruminantium]USG68502.1 RNA polymerase sigma factor [Brevibacillus ruminantium]
MTEIDDEERRRLLCETYYRDVYEFMIYFTGNRNNAEDLTQEVFLRALDALRRYEERSSMKTWILTIAKYVAIDHARKKRIRSWFELDMLKGITSSLGSPEKELQVKEERQQLIAAMQKLKPKYRNVVIFRGLKEYSIKETAEILGCSEAKVRVDYHRAVKELKGYLKGYMEGAWARGLSR